MRVIAITLFCLVCLVGSVRGEGEYDFPEVVPPSVVVVSGSGSGSKEATTVVVNPFRESSSEGTTVVVSQGSIPSNPFRKGKKSKKSYSDSDIPSNPFRKGRKSRKSDSYSDSDVPSNPFRRGKGKKSRKSYSDSDSDIPSNPFRRRKSKKSRKSYSDSDSDIPSNPFRRHKGKKSDSDSYVSNNPFRRHKGKKSDSDSYVSNNPFRRHKGKKDSDSDSYVSNNPFRRHKGKKSKKRDSRGRKSSKNDYDDSDDDDDGKSAKSYDKKSDKSSNPFRGKAKKDVPYVDSAFMQESRRSLRELKCLKRYFVASKREVKIRRREHRRLARILRRSARCRELSCKREWERRQQRLERRFRQERRERSAKRNGLRCAKAARAALGIAKHPRNARCFFQYYTLVAKEIKTRKEEHKQLHFLFRDARRCVTLKCRQHYEKLQKKFEEKMIVNQKHRSAKRRKLACSVEARIAAAASMEAKVSIGPDAVNSGRQMMDNTTSWTTGVNGLPLWAVPVIVGGVLILGSIVLLIAFLISRRMAKKKEASDTYVRLDDEPVK